MNLCLLSVLVSKQAHQVSIKEGNVFYYNHPNNGNLMTHLASKIIYIITDLHQKYTCTDSTDSTMHCTVYYAAVPAPILRTQPSPSHDTQNSLF